MHDLNTYGLESLDLRTIENLNDVSAVGRVTRIERDWDCVATDNGIVKCERRLGEFGDYVEPAVGDWVTHAIDEQQDPPAKIITSIVERKNEVKRKRSSAGQPRPQVIAANVEHCVIVVGLDSGLNKNRLIRSLIMILDADAIPILALTKPDLVSEKKLEKAQRIASEASSDLITLAINAKNIESVETLRQIIEQPDSTAALVGASGAGKSTLMNSLCGSGSAVTQEVRASDNRGRHTTTYKDMRPMNKGAVLIDTPGIRSVGLWQADHGLEKYFWPIYEAIATCQFSRCTHTGEADCGIKNGVSNGTLEQELVDLWRQLNTENDESHTPPS